MSKDEIMYNALIEYYERNYDKPYQSDISDLIVHYYKKLYGDNER